MATLTGGLATYDVGDAVELLATLESANGQLVDPPTVRCRVMDPTGVVVTYTYGTDMALVRDGTGSYRLRIAVTVPGHWWYRWETADDVGPLGAVEGWFEVERSRFT